MRCLFPVLRSSLPFLWKSIPRSSTCTQKLFSIITHMSPAKSPYVVMTRSFSVFESTQEFSFESEIATDDSIKVPKTVHTIVGYVRDKVGTAFHEENAVSIISYLIKDSLPPRHIAEGLKENPQLLQFSLEKWQSAVQILRDYGFKNDRIMPILFCHQALFHGKTEKLYNIGESLRHIGFHDGAVQRILCNNPSLLNMSSSNIVKRFNLLLKTFQRKEIIQLALESSNILSEDFSTIEKKMNYIYEKMGIDFKEMVRYNALSYTFLRIKARHLFLERAGLYKSPDPDRTKKTENATLKQIVQYDNKQFAKKVAGMSLAEYETFDKMIALEEKYEEKLAREVFDVDMVESEEEDEESDDETNDHRK